MNMTPGHLLSLALLLYGAGTMTAVISLLLASRTRAQVTSFALMLAGFIAHTMFIGTICVRTGRPPLLNLAEIAAFIGWTVLLIELVIYIRLRIYAAALVIYPLVFLLLLVTALVGDPLSQRAAAPPSLFTAHLLLTSLGVAVLFIGLAFSLTAAAQDRSLKSKTRGRLWEWIPSLTVCNAVSYRALAAGFVLYTVGLIAGFAWSSGTLEIGAKHIGAVFAWFLFAFLVQSQFTGFLRTQRTTLALSGAAFVAVIVAIFGVAHG
jgi:ABC-type uncharacterized transport system permease subunit